ncbi:MAG: thiol protease/hemagglutinin PrtT [Bacteroidales bacterium]|nr:thiol protease/hemagglutinin PrtT [Bacteroidales bacterium]
MKKIVSFFLMATFAATLFANPVNPDKALQVAKHFAMSQVKMDNNNATIVYTHSMPKSGVPAIYAVNVGSSAFVLVAADDVAHPVLGYSTSRAFPEGNIPSHIRAFYDDLAAQMEAAIEAEAYDREIASEWQQLLSEEYSVFNTQFSSPDSVGPLLTTTWDQGQYYNALCPEDANGPAGHVYTGCVATAMAQIINYWGYPVHGRGIHSYQSNYGTLTVNYDSANYDYANMPDALTPTSTPAHINAIATLMRDCGIAANMGYGSSESGAYDIDARAGLINFFRLSPDLSIAEKDYFTNEEWKIMLQNDISLGHPIYYSGHGTGGHAFVCDGYKSNNYFHFNFGWSGYADGWYLTTAVNPAGMDYNSIQYALFGIIPENNGNVILGQMAGNSTFVVDEPLKFYHLSGNNQYQSNTTGYCDNVVTFVSSEANGRLICDVLDFDEDVIQYIDIKSENGWYRVLGFNNFDNNDYTTLETTGSKLIFDYYGTYGTNGFGFYIQKQSGCRMVSSVSLNNVNDGLSSSVNVEWVDNTNSGPWQIRYRAYGVPVDSATIINVSTNPYTISGLTTGELYYFSVRNQCGINANIWSYEYDIIVDIPHWTDVVTTQPSGYIEDSSGNVEISTAEGLAWLSVKVNGLHNQPIMNYLNKRIKIVADIDLQGYRWFPIASLTLNFDAVFKGVFDGDNHIISNIYVNESKTQKCGLFAFFEGDTIKNVIINGNVKNKYYYIPEQGNTGGLIGGNFGGVIENCHSSVNVYGMCRIGSLCGYSIGRIMNSSSNGIVYGRANCGGLLGHAAPGSETINCYSTGNVLSNNSVEPLYCVIYHSYRGGLIGYTENSIVQNCYASGYVESETGGYTCGTVIGLPTYSSELKNLYGLAINDLELFGYNEESLVMEDTASFLLNNDTCILSSPVSVRGENYSNMIDAMNAWVYETNNQSYRLWEKDSININNGYPVFGDYYEPSCYNSTNLSVSNATIVGDSIIRTEFSWEQIGEPNYWEILYVPTRHNIDEGIVIQVNSNPCVLTGIPVGFPLDFYVRAVCGDGDTSGWSNPVTYIPDKLYWTEVVTSQPEGYQVDANGNIHIYTAEGLAWLAHIVNEQYDDRIVYLESDIDLGQYRWYPIGDGDFNGYWCPFGGEFWGRKHTISNLYCNELKDYLGLFGRAGGSIKDLNIKDCRIYGEGYIGAISASLGGGEIVNCCVTGEIGAWAMAGGLVGEGSGITIRNSYYNGSFVYRDDMYSYYIPGYYGGIASYAYGSVIENCYVSSHIPNMNWSGLIAGCGTDPYAVSNCYCLYDSSDVPFITSNIPTFNLSYFTGSNNNWTLNTPSYINGEYYSDLVEALNAWVDANNTNGQYRHWAADSANVNGGFPVFEAMSCPVIDIHDTIVACESYTWNGNIYTSSVVVTNTFHLLNDCDSIVTLHLTINNPVHTATTETACESYLWNGELKSESGEYTYAHIDANGCTQVDTLHLTINNPAHTATTEMACESYTWNETVYYVSGDYTYNHTDANGCTQVDTLHLTISNPVHTATTDTACETYTWNGTVFTVSGDYTYSHTDANGCTQVDTLHLTVNYGTTGDTVVTATDYYIWNNYQYNSNGDYVQYYQSAIGCDSIVTLHLTINHRPQGAMNLSCMGLKNPMNFTVSGSHQEKWTGYTGSKESMMSSCISEGSTYTNTIQAASLESVVSSDGCSISLESEMTRMMSRDIHGNLDHMRQFVIKGAGCDPETHYHLSYLPPDTSFTSSIRLGNYCGGHGAEKLTYELYVQPENAIVTLWYALSLQNGQHNYNANPEFSIVIERNIGTVSNPNWIHIGGDTLCLIRTSPASGQPIAPFYAGSTGEQYGASVGDNIYLPWQRVMIDLSNNIYQKVRLRISSGDCAYSTHYGMAYIAGDCQPAGLHISGCPNNEVQVEAPKGAIVYEWYRSNTGVLPDNQRYNTGNYQLFAVDSIGSASLSTAEFVNIITGDTMDQNTIMCRVRSSMNGWNSRMSVYHIDVTKPVSLNFYETACENYIWRGETYTVSGNYSYTAIMSNGCDSTVTLHLTINNPQHTAQTETECDSYTWNGMSYINSGHYTYNHSDVNGCMQVDTLHLNIKHSTVVDTFAIACENFIWNGATYTSSGIMTHYISNNAVGCDSSKVLHLTINNPVHTATTETACESYAWNGIVYTASGNYNYTHLDNNGCTQVDTLHLTINNPVHTATTQTACETYTWNGTAYTTSGNYNYTHLDNNGCTQVDTLHLTINNPMHTAITETACETFLWNGELKTESGEYTYSHLDNNGCTQVDTLHLTINYNTTGDTTATACDSFIWHGTTFTESTQNSTFTIPNSKGCDSTITLHLTINHSVILYDTLTVGSNELPYDYHGNAIDGEGDYTFTGTTVEGCDSTMYLNVVVNQVGIYDIQNSEFEIQLYPNPTGGLLTIEGKGVERVEVLDVLGRVVADQFNESINGTMVMDLSSLPQGAYTLRAISKFGTAVRRIIKN